jgi:hypothetical protein
MHLTRHRQTLLATVAMILGAACNRTENLTPEAARAKGDQMLRQMSATVAAMTAFSYTTEQSRERVERNGEKVEKRFIRRVIVRRPNALAYHDEGPDSDAAAWYDGKSMTLVSNRNKAWARGPMPATLDEALDFVSAEYAVQIPTADLLYSSPYDALMTADTTGGWVNTEQVDTRTCEHLSYRQSVVDWQLWLTADDRRLPCKVQITYKNDPGSPVTSVVFRDWSSAPEVTDATFTAAIPEGYRRIRLMRYATVEAPAPAEGTTDPASASPAKPR